MKIVSGAALSADIKALGCVMQTVPRDATNACPSKEWMIGFGLYCRQYQPAKPESGEGGDCDDAAIWCVNEARKAALADVDCRGHGFAVCYCQVALSVADDEGNLFGLNGIPGGTDHVTILIRCDDDLWYFFEPQTGLFCLAKAVIDSGGVGLCFVLV